MTRDARSRSSAQAAEALPPGPGTRRALMFVASHEHTPIDAGLALDGDSRVRVRRGPRGADRVPAQHDPRPCVRRTGARRAPPRRGRAPRSWSRSGLIPIFSYGRSPRSPSSNAQLHAGEGREALRDAMRLEGTCLGPDHGSERCDGARRASSFAPTSSMRFARDSATSATVPAPSATRTASPNFELHFALLECRAGRFDSARRPTPIACLTLLDQGHEARPAARGGAVRARVRPAARSTRAVTRICHGASLHLWSRDCSRRRPSRLRDMNHLCTFSLDSSKLSFGYAAATLSLLDRCLQRPNASASVSRASSMFHGDIFSTLSSPQGRRRTPRRGRTAGTNSGDASTGRV